MKDFFASWIVTGVVAVMFLLSFCLILFWIFQLCHNQSSNVDKKFIILNGAASCCFTGVSFAVLSHCVLLLISTDNSQTFFTDFESDYLFDTDKPIVLYCGMLLYLIGKYLLYLVLYLRLYFCLRDSIFRLSNKQYKIIKCLIMVCVISGFIATIISSFEEQLGIFVYCSYIAYLLLDLTVPIWLNVLFVMKLYKVGRWMRLHKIHKNSRSNVVDVGGRPRARTLSLGSPNTPNVSTSNNGKKYGNRGHVSYHDKQRSNSAYSAQDAYSISGHQLKHPKLKPNGLSYKKQKQMKRALSIQRFHIQKLGIDEIEQSQTNTDNKDGQERTQTGDIAVRRTIAMTSSAANGKGRAKSKKDENNKNRLQITTVTGLRSQTGSVDSTQCIGDTETNTAADIIPPLNINMQTGLTSATVSAMNSVENSVNSIVIETDIDIEDIDDDLNDLKDLKDLTIMEKNYSNGNQRGAIDIAQKNVKIDAGMDSITIIGDINDEEKKGSPFSLRVDINSTADGTATRRTTETNSVSQEKFDRQSGDVTGHNIGGLTIKNITNGEIVHGQQGKSMSLQSTPRSLTDKHSVFDYVGQIQKQPTNIDIKQTEEKDNKFQLNNLPNNKMHTLGALYPSKHNTRTASTSVTPKKSKVTPTRTDNIKSPCVRGSRRSNHKRQGFKSKLVEEVSQHGKLLRVVARFSLLTMLIAVSSVLCIVWMIIMVVMHSNDDDKSGMTDNVNINIRDILVSSSIRWTLMSVDACANVVCLVFYFPFSLKVIRCLCPCCKLECFTKCLKTK